MEHVANYIYQTIILTMPATLGGTFRGKCLKSASYGALFYCKMILAIFINMNRLFAFIQGSIAIVVAGLYSVYEMIIGVYDGSKNKD
jgi:hypothetical protein